MTRPHSRAPRAQLLVYLVVELLDSLGIGDLVHIISTLGKSDSSSGTVTLAFDYANDNVEKVRAGLYAATESLFGQPIRIIAFVGREDLESPIDPLVPQGSEPPLPT